MHERILIRSKKSLMLGAKYDYKNPFALEII